MRPGPSKTGLLAAVALLGLGVGLVPAISQDRPESILPPGFGEPDAPLPPPAPPPGNPAAPDGSRSQSTPVRPPSTILPPSEGEPTGDEEEIALEPPPPPIEIPDEARRPIDLVGTIDEASGGLPEGAWGNAHGKYLSVLMRRTNAPLPSRWAHIALRRALLSRLPAPRGVHPVDWVAERAWLLLRMGEADGARLLVQGVDVDRFTPKMYDVAVQAALATADPGALCPLIEGGRAYGNKRVWPLANAMCASLGGEGGRASADIVSARRQRGGARGLDLLLAEKVVGAGINMRRAVTIQWDGVERLTAWRYGMANATGLVIPAALFDAAGAQTRAWQARAPLMTLTDRLPYAKAAAALGVFSGDSLVQMYSLMGDDLDIAEIRDSDPGRLQVAYTGPGPARIAALRALWNAGGEGSRYANLVLTSRAATGLNPGPTFASDADSLVASMFAGGLARPASRWSGFVDGREDADRAWAMLAVGAALRSVDASSGRIDAFVDRDTSPAKLRSKLLVAAMAGLGRIDTATRQSYVETLGLPLGAADDWTRAIDAAARDGQGATVMLLTATGMQARDWRGVPPAHLFRIVRALRACGQDYAARMIAAEALGRT